MSTTDGPHWHILPVGANQHIVPCDDAMPHELTTRCPCRPRWLAHWHPGFETIIWQFSHTALDGRE